MIHHHWTGKEFIDIDVPAEVVGRLKERRQWILGAVLIGYIAGVLLTGSVIDSILHATRAPDDLATAVVTIGTLAGLACLFSLRHISEWISDHLERSIYERYVTFGRWPN